MEAYKKKKKSKAVANFVTAFGPKWLRKQHNERCCVVRRSVCIAPAAESPRRGWRRGAGLTCPAVKEDVDVVFSARVLWKREEILLFILQSFQALYSIVWRGIINNFLSCK